MTTSLAVMHPGGRFSREMLQRSLQKATEALAGGVVVRALHESTALALPRQLEYLRALEAAGVQVRLRTSLPFRVVIADGGFAACSMGRSDGGPERFVVRGALVTGLLLRVYDATWQDAATLASWASGSGPLAGRPHWDESVEPAATALAACHCAAGPSAAGPQAAAGAPHRHPHPAPVVTLSEQQRLILRVLAGGGTDRAVAQALGVTTRTVTRRIAELYEVLGVESRFQAGVVADRLGLV